MYGYPSMATQGGEESSRRTQRQGPSLCEERRAQLETAATRGRIKARLFLRKDEGYEKQTHISKDSERPEL